MQKLDRKLDSKLFEEIRGLEECLWRGQTRFDNSLMDKIFAPDFVEFGRSGKIYSRSEMFFLADTNREILATLPLINFHARYLSDDIIQTTYVSEVIHDGETLRANRSSIWSSMEDIWRLRFHQGTAIGD